VNWFVLFALVFGASVIVYAVGSMAYEIVRLVWNRNK
jgi:hypothetical protein